MFKNRLIKVALLFLLLFIQCSEDKPLNVIYISNEGFLFESGSKKILIDALFGGFDADWCDVPDKELISAMENVSNPFNNVDLILVTHNHIDHFNAEIVANHLANNPKGILICTPQTHTLLKNNQNYSKFSSQIQEVLPQAGESISKNIHGIDINVLRFSHSKYMEKDEATGEMVNRHRNVENIGFLITINGHKIFHNGDAWFFEDKEYLDYKLSDENIDIAFVQAFPTNKIITDIIHPKNFVMMHVDPESRDKYVNLLTEYNLTNAIIFNYPLESKEYTIKEGK